LKHGKIYTRFAVRFDVVLMKEYVLGIDVGTSGCKTVIVDADGAEAAGVSKNYSAKTEGENADMDPYDWWEAAIEAIAECCEKAEISPLDIVAVGCSGQMQGCTFIGYDGKPVRDSMLWFGNISLDVCSEMNAKYQDVFLQNCLVACRPSFTASKIKWLMKHEPENWKKTNKFLFAPGFVSYMLTGRLTADRSNLALSGLNNVLEDDWSNDLLNIVGVEKDKLPELFNCDAVIGNITAHASKLTGLRVGIPVIAGCGDGPGESFSVNIAGKPEVKIRLGSACAANAIVPRDWYGTKVKKVSPYVNTGFFSTGGYTSGCALSVKWARDTFFSELPKADESYEKMDMEAANTPVGCRGMIFHPYLIGESSHYNDSTMRAKFTGMHISHQRGDFVRAVYEGVSFSIRDLIENSEALRAMERFVFCGGGTKSRLWMSILTGVLGKGGVIPKSADAAFGVALLAGEAVGLFDASKAADKSKNAGVEIPCNQFAHIELDRVYSRYIELVHA
jgi:xylulokinase